VGEKTCFSLAQATEETMSAGETELPVHLCLWEDPTWQYAGVCEVPTICKETAPAHVSGEIRPSRKSYTAVPQRGDFGQSRVLKQISLCPGFG